MHKLDDGIIEGVPLPANSFTGKDLDYLVLLHNWALLNVDRPPAYPRTPNHELLISKKKLLPELLPSRSHQPQVI
jgi:hypothetical protein